MRAGYDFASGALRFLAGLFVRLAGLFVRLAGLFVLLTGFLFYQVKNAKLLKIDCFFTWHIILGVGKSQDLPSKI